MVALALELEPSLPFVKSMPQVLAQGLSVRAFEGHPKVFFHFITVKIHKDNVVDLEEPQEQNYVKII